jgi:insulysin
MASLVSSAVPPPAERVTTEAARVVEGIRVSRSDPRA